MKRIHTLICAVVLLFIGAAGARAEVDDGLVAHWTMDAVMADRAVDATGNGYDLQLGSGVTPVAGVNGAALFWDGTTDAWATCEKELPALVNRTISFWIKREAGSDGPCFANLTAGEGYPYLLAGFSSWRIHLTANPSHNQNRMTVFVDGNRTAAPRPAALYLMRGLWSFVVMTYEGEQTGTTDNGSNLPIYTGTFRYYQDGQLQAFERNLVSTNIAVSSKIVLGNHSNVKDRPIYGALDDVRIYNRALAQDEIEDLYTRDVSGANAVYARYSAEEISVGAGGNRTLPDESGLGHDLTLGADMALVDDGKFGKALHFPDSLDTTWASLNTDGLGCGLSSLTFTGWIRRQNLKHLDDEARNNYPTLLNSPGVFKWSFGWNRMNEPLGLSYLADDRNNVAPIATEAGEWNHLVLVLKSRWDETAGRAVGSYRQYLNGVLVGEIELPAPNENVSPMWGAGGQRTFTFGNLSTTGTRSFSGDFDEFALYSGALPETEIQKLYLANVVRVEFTDSLTTSLAELPVRNPVIVNAAEAENVETLLGDPSVDWQVVEIPEQARAEEVGVVVGSAVSRLILPEVAGTYRFRITTTTRLQTFTNELTVLKTLTPPSGNRAPTLVVSASASEVTLPQSAVLSLQVADADGDPVTTRWSVSSGSAGVVFEDAGAAVTRVAFPSAGVYYLQAEASDGYAVVTDRVTVTVSASGLTADAWQQTLTDRLYASWTFDGTDPWLDESGNNFSLTGYTENSVLGDGKQGNGLCYDAGTQDDAKSRRRTSGNLSYGATDQISISFWAKLNEAYSSKITGGVVMLWGGTPNWELTQMLDGSIQFALNNGSGSGRVIWTAPASETGLSTAGMKADWFFVTLVTDFTQTDTAQLVKLYVNGRPCAVTPNAPTFTQVANSAYLQLGGANWDNASFPGALDDFKIYKRALSAAEVRLLMNEKTAVMGPEAPAVLFTDVTTKLKIRPRDPVIVGLAPDGATVEMRVVSGPADALDCAVNANREIVLTCRRTGDYLVQFTARKGEAVAYSDAVTIHVQNGLVVVVK